MVSQINNEMENITQASNNRDKKMIRKQKRLQHMLHADCGINSSEEPTNFIAVLNAGVATCLDEEGLLTVCEEFGRVNKLIALPGRSYCFLVLDSVECSRKIFENVHGGTKLAQGGYPLYLSHVTDVPPSEDVTTKEMPEGLTLLSDFITKNEEEILLSAINWNDEATSKNMKHRRVKHYGYEFMYSNNNIDLNRPLDESIPRECDFLWTRLKERTNIINDPPNQLTINQYNPGQGIPSHVDTHSAFLSPILSLSLGADVVMEFKRKHEKYNQTLPARSLLIMDGAARYEWTHGISPRTYDLVNGRTRSRQQRTSFTFRWVRPDARCYCNFQSQCDTFTKKSKEHNNTMDDHLAALIERQHVHEVYNNIASHFHETRSKIWTSVRCFVDSLPPDTILIDIGCGNGKNLRLRDDIMQIGVEYNETLSEVAVYHDSVEDLTPWKGRMQVIRGDCLAVPLNTCSVDAVISIAVFHHLATQERRIQAINEVIRVLRPGGKTLITVWAKDQSRGEKTSYLKQDRKNRRENNTTRNDQTEEVTEELRDSEGKPLNISLPVHVNRSQFQHQDLLVPWKLKKQSEKSDDGTFMRYYHVFEEGELEEICKEIPGVKLVQSFYEQGNWCVVLEKVK